MPVACQTDEEMEKGNISNAYTCDLIADVVVVSNPNPFRTRNLIWDLQVYWVFRSKSVGMPQVDQSKQSPAHTYARTLTERRQIHSHS